MEKRRWDRYIPYKDLQQILDEQFPGRLCSKCGADKMKENVDRQYDDARDEYIICSIDVWCHACGNHCGAMRNIKFDNNTKPFLS